jgi:hypothetical protein
LALVIKGEEFAAPAPPWALDERAPAAEPAPVPGFDFEKRVRHLSYSPQEVRVMSVAHCLSYFARRAHPPSAAATESVVYSAETTRPTPTAPVAMCSNATLAVLLATSVSGTLARSAESSLAKCKTFSREKVEVALHSKRFD